MNEYFVVVTPVIIVLQHKTADIHQNIRSLSQILGLFRILRIIIKFKWQAQIDRYWNWFNDKHYRPGFCYPTIELSIHIFVVKQLKKLLMSVCGCTVVAQLAILQTRRLWNGSKLKLTCVVHTVLHMFIHMFILVYTHDHSNIHTLF